MANFTLVILAITFSNSYKHQSQSIIVKHLLGLWHVYYRIVIQNLTLGIKIILKQTNSSGKTSKIFIASLSQMAYPSSKKNCK